MAWKSVAVSSRGFLFYVLCAVTAIFYLPYLIPQSPSASSSYLFGYNNKAGVVLLLLFLGVGVIWTRGLHLPFSNAVDNSRVSRKTLVYSLIAVLLGCAAMYLFAGRLGGFGESSYEIDRIWLLSIGKRPYVDFEWPFGLGLLYGPLALQRLLHLDGVQAYSLFWSLNCLLGVWLLYLVVNAAHYLTSRKNEIFLLIYFAWFLSIMNMGTHYSLTRYTLPLYFVLTTYKRIQQTSTGVSLRTVGVILLFTTVLFLYSPETAIAYSFASVAIFVVVADRNGPSFITVAASLLGGIGLLIVGASKLHILDTVKASGGGADSFPVVLSPHILLFFVALYLCGCYVYQRLTTQSLRDNTFGLIAYSFPMLPAALGRCDAGHVLFNCLGVFIACLLYVSNNNVVWKWSRNAFIVILIVFPSIGLLWSYAPLLARCGIAQLTSADKNSFLRKSVLHTADTYIERFAPPDKKKKWQEHLAALEQDKVRRIATIPEMYPRWKGGYLAPFGYKPNGFGNDLTTQIDYGRYEGLENANTVMAIANKVSELQTSPEKALLLPEGYESFCKTDGHQEKRVIQVLFLSPYFKAPVHPDSVRQPICAFIQTRYELLVNPSANTHFYGVWINREMAASPSIFQEGRHVATSAAGTTQMGPDR